MSCSTCRVRRRAQFQGSGAGSASTKCRRARRSGTFQFRPDTPYNPTDPATFPFQFSVTVGPPSDWGYEVFSRDRRYYAFAEDKWRVAQNMTLNLGLRYDRQHQTPDATLNFAPASVHLVIRVRF